MLSEAAAASFISIIFLKSVASWEKCIAAHRIQLGPFSTKGQGWHGIFDIASSSSCFTFVRHSAWGSRPCQFNRPKSIKKHCCTVYRLKLKLFRVPHCTHNEGRKQFWAPQYTFTSLKRIIGKSLQDVLWHEHQKENDNKVHWKIWLYVVRSLRCMSFLASFCFSKSASWVSWICFLLFLSLSLERNGWILPFSNKTKPATRMGV